LITRFTDHPFPIPNENPSATSCFRSPASRSALAGRRAGVGRKDDPEEVVTSKNGDEKILSIGSTGSTNG
jgi:hypothetical protein